MLISLPAKVPTHPPPLTSPSTCFYADSPASSLLEGTCHAVAGEASWLQFSPAAKQVCRSGLSAGHKGCKSAIPQRRQIARPQCTNTDTAASGAL
jgi:hypothetical protein